MRVEKGFLGAKSIFFGEGGHMVFRKMKGGRARTGSDGLLKGDQSLLMEYKRRTIRNRL